MDPLTILILGALGYAIFGESDEDRRKREAAEAAYRAQVQREREAREQRQLEWQHRRQQELEASLLEEQKRNRKFASTSECFAEQYVSFTRMKMYLTCPLQFKLTYLDRVKRKDDLLQFGKGRAVHEMIESYLEPMVGDDIDSLDSRELLNHLDYDALWQIPYMAYKTKKELLDHFHLRELATHFCRTFPKDVELVAVEHEVSFVLNGVKVYGIADAIVRHESGQCEIIDFKTGSRLPVREQLELYCLPLAQDTSALPMRLRYMRLDKEYHHSWTVGREDLLTIGQRMSSVISRMLDDRTFRPICGKHCASCMVSEECLYDEYDSDEYPVPSGHFLFAPLRWRKPNVSAYEFAEDFHKLVPPPKPRGRAPTGKAFEYVLAKQEYVCLEMKRKIAPGEYHFADHNGKRLSVDGFLQRFPARRDEVLKTIQAKTVSMRSPAPMVAPTLQPPASAPRSSASLLPSSPKTQDTAIRRDKVVPKPSQTSSESEVIAEASNISSQEWFAASRWTSEHNCLQPRDRVMLYNMGRLIARKTPISFKQARYAIRLLKQAKQAGFIVQ